MRRPGRPGSRRPLRRTGPSCLVSQDVMALSSKLLGHVRRKMLRTGLPPVLDDLDEDGTLRPGSTLRPKSVG